MAKEIVIEQEARGFVAKIILRRDPLSKEPIAVRTLGGFHPSREEAEAVAQATLTPTEGQVTPTKAELVEEPLKKGGKK